MGSLRSSSAALASMADCGGRGLRCNRLSSGSKVSEVSVNVRKDASASRTTEFNSRRVRKRVT
jgi:hypothetical protein